MRNQVTKTLYNDIPSYAFPGVSSRARLDNLLGVDADKLRVAEDKFTLPLVITSSLVLLSSFQFGYHIGVINAPQSVIQKEMGENLEPSAKTTRASA